MIRMIFLGRELHLLFSAAALFEIEALEEAWNAGHIEDASISEMIAASGPEGGEALARVAGILSEAGASAREYTGQARGDEMTGDALVKLLPVMTPKDLLDLRTGVTEALAEGFRVSGAVAADQVIDLGLQELDRRDRSKKGRPGRRSFVWPRWPASGRGTR